MISNDTEKTLSNKPDHTFPCVQDVMTSETVSLGPNNNVADAICLMATRHIQHILVVDTRGQIVGEVSYSGILYALARGDISQTKNVKQVMNRKLTTVSPHTPLSTAVAMALGNGDACLAVLTDDGAVCGTVSNADLLKSYKIYLESLEK
jgi:CBS domain-containing protein